MSSSNEVESLIFAAKNGCATSLGKLLDCYRRHLQLAATARIHPRFRCKVAPSDLVQMTLQLAHQNFRGFRGSTQAECLAWLRTILANQHLKEVRRFKALQRDLDLETPLELHTNAPSSNKAIAIVSYRDPSPSKQLMRREVSEQLDRALANLPKDSRLVIELRHVDAKSFAEIADEMNRTIDSVKSLWRRAILKLKASSDLENVL